MEEKKISELKATVKEWGTATGKVFHQVDKELWIKWRIAVGFGIVIVWLLGALVAQADERHEKSFERGFGDRQAMMQERGGMMRDLRQWEDKGEARWFGNMQWIQGCSQQATVEIDPANPDLPMIKMQWNCPFADQKDWQGRGARYQEWTGEQGFFDRMETRMKNFFGSDKKWATDTATVATGDAK